MDVREKATNEKRLIDYDKMYLSVMDTAFSSCDEDTIFDIMDDSVVDASEVAPVRHGRWIWRNKWEPFECKYECSICHDGSDLESKYCPNCGAKMDGGAD